MMKNYDNLIEAASKASGISPEKLRQSLEKNDYKTLISGLSKEDKEKLRSVLQNKELVSKLKAASSPDELMRILGKK